MITAVFIGCATTGGPTPIEEATATMAAFHEAMEALDVEGMLAPFSDDYMDSLGSPKTMLRNLFEGIAMQGMAINVAKCDVVAEEDGASATVVYHPAAGPPMSHRMTLQREADGVWRIVRSEQLY